MRLLAFGLLSVVALGVVVAGASCSTFSEDESAGAETGAEGSLDGPSVDGPDATRDAGTVDAVVALATDLGDDLSGVDTNTRTAFVIKRDEGIILSVALEGSEGAAPVGTIGVLAPSAILAFDDRIVWADFGHHTLSTFTFDGGTTQEMDAGDGPAAIARVPAASAGPDNSSDLVVGTLDPDSGAASVSVWTAEPFGSKGVLYANSSRANLFDVAATANALYWTESSAAAVRVFPNGGLVGTVANSQDPESIAAEGMDVYWATPASGSPEAGAIHSFRGTQPGMVAEGETGPFSLAVDGKSLYWLTSDGTLRRAARAGGAPETLASGFKVAFIDPRVQAIALTSTYVVWITSDGRVLRLPK